MKRTSRVNTFLIEIILVILFFAVSSAVVIQLFAAGHRRSADSEWTNVAMIKVQSVAEQIKGLPELTDRSLQGVTYCGEMQISGEKAEKSVLFSDNWQEADADTASGYLRIQIQISQEEAGQMLTATLIAGRLAGEREEDPLYKLTTETYFPGAQP